MKSGDSSVSSMPRELIRPGAKAEAWQNGLCPGIFGIYVVR